MERRRYMRKARRSDLDQMTAIGISAFDNDPQWIFRYPHRKAFATDHYEYTRRRYEEWLEASLGPCCTIMVVEGPSKENPSVNKVLGFCIWKMPTRMSEHNDKSLSSVLFYTSENLSSNEAYTALFSEAASQRQTTGRQREEYGRFPRWYRTRAACMV